MQSSEFFAYSWHIDENETNVTIIRVYGLNAQNENVCVIVPNFTPYIYVELPDHIQWSDGKLEPILERIRKASTDCPPVKMALQYKKRLYYAHLDKDGKRKLFPYLFLAFSHINDVKKISGFFRRPMNIFGLGELHFKVHENNASPILQLTSLRKIPTAGWISFAGKRVTDETEKITRCKFEYKVRWQNLSEKITEKVARPLMMGWDIEVYSSNPSAMPRAHKPEDKVFQISCVFARQGDIPNLWERYLLTLKKPDEKTEIKIEDANVLVFDTEDQLFLGYVDLMQKKQPNIIIGYNIFQFDINYMVQRSKEILMNIDKFDRQGLDKYGHAKERIIEWDSSAYKNQSFQFLDAEGRIFVDLLPIIKRDHKLSNYQLKTVALEFLKDMTKDPLDHKAIFKCYRIGMTGGLKGSQALSLVGKYCIKDSELVVRLFEKLTCWIALCEMSKVTNVPIFALFTQGQQLKVFSQIYKKCCHENIVVERDGYISKEDEHYIGATVFPPTPGVYDKVVPFDFCLTGDTEIHTCGNIKRLDQIRGDEEVLGYNEKTKKFGYFKIIGKLQRKGYRGVITVSFADKSKITCTPEHKFMLIDGSWCEARLSSGRVCMRYNGGVSAEGIHYTGEVREVFDIEVDQVHNFVANGIVVHNCSLYPTSIIATNIDYSTLVPEDSKIPDEKCNVLEWEEHVGCEHDPRVIRKKEIIEILKKMNDEMKEIRKQRDLKKNKDRKPEYREKLEEFKEKMRPLREEKKKLSESKNKFCGKRKYKFLKEPMGVLPEILTYLLEARSKTKKEMKGVKKKLEEMDPSNPEYIDTKTLLEVLDKRQNAFKISANSGYGAMGVKRGALPFMPGAMCTTYVGRKAIEKASSVIQKDYGGVLIYGDTDSNYVSFPTLKTAQECWDYSVKVASEVTKLYPKPMALAFEEKIYWRFLILTKKRYMCLSCERDGKISNNISKKGVLLNRRDNSEIIRNIYGNVILDIFNKKPIQDILNYIIDELNKICSFSYPWRSYVITKEVGDDGDLVLGAGKDKSGKECYKVGDYKINARYLLSSDAKEREKQLEAKDAGNAKEYYLKCLPAQVQLAHRMKVRGNPVAPGTRLEFVITSEGGQKALQAVKNESADYFARHSDVLRIDFMYYIKQLANPLDQVLEIIFKDTLPGKRDFVLNQYKYRSVVRDRVLRDIEKLFKPKLVFP